jgi:hypothetical protein
MPKVKKEQEKEYLELIRRVLVYYPDAGVLTIQRILEQPTRQRPEGLHLDRGYLTKLVRKIRNERAIRINRGTIARISELQDHFRTLAAEIATIVTNPAIEPKDKGALLIKLFEKNLALFEAEQNAGIFERKLGTVDIRHDIAPDIKISILKAMANYGLINYTSTDGATIEQPTNAQGNGANISGIQNSLPSPLSNA